MRHIEILKSYVCKKHIKTRIDMKRQKEWDFCFNHKSIYIFYPKLYIKMILNSVMKDIYIYILYEEIV